MSEQIGVLTTKLDLLEKARRIEIKHKEKRDEELEQERMALEDESAIRRREDEELEMRKDERERHKLVQNMIETPGILEVKDVLVNFEGD